MNARTTAWSVTLISAGVIIGFLAATYGAAAAMAEMTRERDEARDRMAASLTTMTELAAVDLAAARTERDTMAAELDRRQQPKQTRRSDEAS